MWNPLQRLQDLLCILKGLEQLALVLDGEEDLGRGLDIS